MDDLYHSQGISGQDPSVQASQVFVHWLACFIVVGKEGIGRHELTISDLDFNSGYVHVPFSQHI